MAWEAMSFDSCHSVHVLKTILTTRYLQVWKEKCPLNPLLFRYLNLFLRILLLMDSFHNTKNPWQNIKAELRTAMSIMIKYLQND